MKTPGRWLLFVLLLIGVLTGINYYNDNPMSKAENGNEDVVIADILDKIKATLAPGETLLRYAVERKGYAMMQFHKRTVIGSTPDHFIVAARGLFGGLTITAYAWRDVGEPTYEYGKSGGDIFLKVLANNGVALPEENIKKLSFYGLRAEQTMPLYYFAVEKSNLRKQVLNK